MPGMRKIMLFGIAALAGLAGGPALAGASDFALVNQTGSALNSVQIRRTTTSDWKPLGAAPSPGARQAVKFSDPDCAFDIQANVQGAGTVTWGGVNLCGTKAVILNRSASGAAWADYE